MKAEYKEGYKARENFEDAMKKLFKAPKAIQAKKAAKKPPTKRKSAASDKG